VDKISVKMARLEAMDIGTCGQVLIYTRILNLLGSFRLHIRSCDITHVKMSNSTWDEWMQIILEMMESPPDTNKPLPTANHVKTVMEVTMPFLVGLAMMPKNPGEILMRTGIQLRRRRLSASHLTAHCA
jgi:hypothetical protein